MILGLISIALFASLTILSFVRIRSGRLIAEFIYKFGFVIGSFVWEDLFVFSLYGLMASIVTVAVGQWKFGLLFFIVFWLVRSAGETLYFFLEQFIEPKHYPHYIESSLGPLRKIFGNISYQQCLIIMQVLFQVIMMSSIISLIILLFSWNSL